MIKFRLYLDKDEETVWLNEMAEEGYAMTGFFAGFYKFEKCEPGKYKYQIDFGERFFGISEGYREFMEEMGLTIVQKWGFWIFLRKPVSEGNFELYTDVDSSIEHYTKIRTLFKVGAIIELICFFIELVVAMSGAKVAVAFMIIVGIMAWALMRAAFKTNYIIAQLKERKGEDVRCGLGNTKFSVLIPIGMLMNCTAVWLKESMILDYTVIIMFQVLALILMIVGIYQSRDGFKEKD